MDDQLLRIKIVFFASLKDFWTQGNFELSAPKGVDAHFILSEVEKKLLVNCAADDLSQKRLKGILSDSVLASERSILKWEEKIFENCELAVLPPVCGG